MSEFSLRGRRKKGRVGVGGGEKRESWEKGREGTFPSPLNPLPFFSSSPSPIPFRRMLHRLEWIMQLSWLDKVKKIK